MKPVELHPAALREVEEASAFIEGHRTGAGERFEDEVRLMLERAARRPQAYPPHGRRGMRKCFLPNFPYKIYFMDRGTHIWVAAVAHQRRRPNYWSKRKPT